MRRRTKKKQSFKSISPVLNKIVCVCVSKFHFTSSSETSPHSHPSFQPAAHIFFLCRTCQCCQQRTKERQQQRQHKKMCIGRLWHVKKKSLKQSLIIQFFSIYNSFSHSHPFFLPFVVLLLHRDIELFSHIEWWLAEEMVCGWVGGNVYRRQMNTSECFLVFSHLIY